MRDFESELTGPRRLIIGLETPFGPDEINLYGPEGPELYRQFAQQARAEFLLDLAAHWPESTDIEELGELPYLVLFADESLLNFILEHPSVVSVNTESAGRPSLDESIPFIGADTAHGLGYDAAGQVVAIIDTGVDRHHPMFSGKVVSEACYSSAAYSSVGSICRAGSYGSTGTDTGGPCTMERTPCNIDPSACGASGPLDCAAGHGSHVAGIALGSSVTPGSPVPSLIGVANSADVISLMPLSHVDSPGMCDGQIECVRFLEASVAAALNRVYALRNSYSISSVNLSLHLSTSAGDFSASNCDNDWPLVRDAVALLNSAGIRAYAATGNGGNFTNFQNKIGPPACLSQVVSVAATARDSHDFASYSNAAPILDILAPGGLDTLSSGATCLHTQTFVDGVWSAYFQTGCNDDYVQAAGTSMASPHAAGAHAVLKHRYPHVTATALSDWLAASGQSLSFSQGGTNYTRPRIDLAAAMTPPAAPSSGPSSGSVNWLSCYGFNNAIWDTVAGNVTEYHLQGVSSTWMYYQGPNTSAHLISVSQTEDLRVRACNMVSCGPWATIGQATYQPICH